MFHTFQSTTGPKRSNRKDWNEVRVYRFHQSDNESYRRLDPTKSQLSNNCIVRPVDMADNEQFASFSEWIQSINCTFSSLSTLKFPIGSSPELKFLKRNRRFSQINHKTFLSSDSSFYFGALKITTGRIEVPKRNDSNFSERFVFNFFFSFPFCFSSSCVVSRKLNLSMMIYSLTYFTR